MLRTLAALTVLASASALALFAVSSADADDLDRQAAPQDWPQWRGPHRDAQSPAQGISKNWEEAPPELLWQAEGAGKGYGGLAVAGGKIFAVGDFDDGQSVAAFRQADGAELWRTPLTDGPSEHSYDGSRCTPTVDGDRLYVTASQGLVACLRASDGEMLWQRAFEEFGGKMMSGWGYSESPLVDGDAVIVTPGGDDAMLVKLDKSTGEEIWRSPSPPAGEKGKDGAAYSSVVISDGAGVKQYVQLTGRGVIGVRASDGALLWHYDGVANGTANIPTPLIDGDYVFCSTGYGTGSALLKLSADGDGVTAEEQYFLDDKTLQNHHGGMVLIDGRVYCGHRHGEGFPICVDLASGDVLWGGRTRGPGQGSAAVVFVDGCLIFRYQSGDVALIEATPEEYRLLGVFTPAFVEGPSWSHPAIADGKLYLRENNVLMCYDLR